MTLPEKWLQEARRLKKASEDSNNSLLLARAQALYDCACELQTAWREAAFKAWRTIRKGNR